MLQLSNNSIHSFFELIGYKENDLTYGLGYILHASPSLQNVILRELDIPLRREDAIDIHLQRYSESDGGYTDIEIWVNHELMVLIEAKVGWVLPSSDQIEKYRSRINNEKARLIVISQCSNEYANSHLADDIFYVSWKSVYEQIISAYSETSSIIEKSKLEEYKKYLSKFITMDRELLNVAYCVVLSSKLAPYSSISFIDVVEKHDVYFYPYAKGWPNRAPNYMAFRYDGRLQSIRKVVDYEVIDYLHEAIPGVIGKSEKAKHFLLQLGPRIIPNHTVKNGNIYPAQRLWCTIDTLLTCNSIKEARDLTKERIGVDWW